MSNSFTPDALTPAAADQTPNIEQTSVGLQPTGTAPTLTNINQIFGALLEFQWRGIGFPVIDFDTEVVQGLVVHKFVDRDGAHVEATGRAPFRITATIPFLVGLQRGPNEHWQRPLYPFVWRKFFAACTDRTSGILQHPELGSLTVKCESVKTRWAGSVRTGVYATATWIETDDTQVDLTQALENPSPLAQLDAAAADLDSNLAALTPDQFPQRYVPPTSFSDLVSAVRGAIDSVTILEKQFAGQLANIIYQAQEVVDAANRTANASSALWPVIASANQLICSASDLQAQLLNSDAAPIGFYVLAKDMTIAQIASTLGAQAVDIITLNPAFVGFTVLPAGVVVRYYPK